MLPVVSWFEYLAVKSGQTDGQEKCFVLAAVDATNMKKMLL